MDGWKLAEQLTPIAGLGLATWVSWRVSHAADRAAEQQRATLLATIADDAAALVATLFPATTPAVGLIEQVVAHMHSASLPTTNVKAIERAAAGAVSRLNRP